ncbi:MAG: rhomboid family intramembrane serine protease [Bacteroidia bacterium]
MPTASFNRMEVSFLDKMIASPVAVIILLITVLTSIVAFERPDVQRRMLMRPYSVLQHREWYRVFSCTLVHGGILHLAFNGLAYYFFALESGMEIVLGHIEFFILYIGSTVFSAIPALVRHGDNPLYESLGASGAVSGVVLAFILMAPDATLGLLFIPGVTFPAWLMGLFYILFSFVASLRGFGRIDHAAHLFGALGGVLFLVLLKPVTAELFLKWLNHQF